MSDPSRPPTPVQPSATTEPAEAEPGAAEIAEAQTAEAQIADAEIVEAEIVEEVPPADPAAAPSVDYNEHGVPSLDYVRNKIEDRYATSIGATELAGETTESRALDEQLAARDKAAKAKLDEIRKSLRN